MGYDDLTTEEVLEQLIPKKEDQEIVTSFEAIGHIAHMNLNEECIPYKHIIGQVILEKNKHIKTVINKIGEIDNTFRTFKMEVVAGIDDMNTEVKESGCRFRFNFSEVYWNSRLGTEHKRLVELFKPGEVIVDMFAGVGPFAIPAAKSGCIVYANDLNPRSYHYLQINAQLNKCTKNMFCFNMDGRDFIRHLIQEKNHNTIPKQVDHVIMNLPASAVQFLDVFVNLFEEGSYLKLPVVHCYGFSKKTEDVTADMIEQVQKILNQNIENAVVSQVRLVSPKKWMTRISFTLPHTLVKNTSAIEIITPTQIPDTTNNEDQESSSEPKTKRRKIEEKI